MIWIGLDVHKSFSRIGMFDPASGELRDVGSVATSREALTQQLAELPGPRMIVLEAGRNCHHVAALLEPLAEEVWIVDPAQVRQLQRQTAKSDRRDACALAWWAAKGALRPLWRPDADTLALRELTRGKTNLTRLGVQVRNMIRALLARHGYECPYRDLLGASAQRWLAGVQIPGYGGLVLNALLELLPILHAKAGAFETLVTQEAKGDRRAQQLMAICGVGPFIALAMRAEIGDISRFPTPAHLRSYAGLCPSVHQSANRQAYGPLTHRGNRWLRYAAVLAAQRIAALRTADPRLRRTFLSASFRHGRNPGKVACARRLLDLVHHLLTKEEPYRPAPPTVAKPG